MSYIIAKSSCQVVTELTAQTWPPTSTIFKMDAVSIYTNIHLGHALPVILDFLQHNAAGWQVLRNSEILLGPLEYALELVMTYNLFIFGDTYWRQTSGTACPGICHSILCNPRTRNHPFIPWNQVLYTIYWRWVVHLGLSRRSSRQW